MAVYLFENGPNPTTAALVPVATGATIKTLLQVKLAAMVGKIIEWGVSYDGTTAAVPGRVELIETDVAATVTAFVAADITKYDALALAGPADPTTSLIAVGTAASGYTASAEGATTVSRALDGSKLIAPTNQYEKQFPLGREPIIQIGKFARIRMTFPVTVNAYAYMLVEI